LANDILEPDIAETRPELSICEPPDKFHIDAERSIEDVEVFVIGTGLPVFIVELLLPLISPALLMVVPPLKFAVDASNVITPVEVFERLTGLPVVKVDAAFTIICPEFVILVPPPMFSSEPVSVMVPVELLVITPGFPVVMPTDDVELSLPLLTRVPPAFMDNPALKVSVLPEPILSVPGFPTEDNPAKVAVLVPAVAKVVPPLTVKPPETVNAADNVSVVLPVMEIDLQADATSTVGRRVVVGITTSIVEFGTPPDQLPDTLHRVLTLPVQVVAATAALLSNSTKAAIIGSILFLNTL